MLFLNMDVCVDVKEIPKHGVLPDPEFTKKLQPRLEKVERRFRAKSFCSSLVLW